MFNYARLGIAAIENRDLFSGRTILNQAFNLINQPLGLERIARSLHDPYLLALPRFSPQALPQALGVIPNHGVRGIQNMTAGTVVLLKLNQMRNTELTFKVLHVGDVRTTEGID